jgi:DnaJ-class molecular chaperone
MFRKVKAAYDCLVDPIKRETEDLKCKQREQAKAAKKAERQAGQWASAQSTSNTAGISLQAIGLIVIALIVFLAALFGSDERTSHPSATA